MDKMDYKNILENIVHNDLYISDYYDEQKKENINSIISHLNSVDDYFSELRYILSSRTSENGFAYSKYIKEILENAPLSNKLLVLDDYIKNKDIVDDCEIYFAIWDSIDSKDQINYLESRKKFAEIDYKIINYSLNTNDSYKNNTVLNLILSNESIRSKIDPFTIDLNYQPYLLKVFDLANFKECSILSKKTYTTLLLKKCKNFDEFINIYGIDKNIYNLILNNSLIFKDIDNEKIYEFILENNNFIGKFNIKYLDLFNIKEISKISELKTLDNDAYSTVIQKLFLFNKEKAYIYFNEESLRKCSKHSITVNPFDYLSEDAKSTIFNNHNYFNRFIDTIMIEAINNYFEEDIIVSILRDDIFVNDTSTYAIELLLNKLSFKSSFNMLQRKEIFNKISNLNVNIEEKDSIFIKGYLDSPILVHKSDHSLIYDMLNMLNDQEVIYYIVLPYIANNLSNNEIVNLICKKKINLSLIVNNNYLRNKLNPVDFISCIDNRLSQNVDLSIFTDKQLSKMIFNLTDEQTESIDFNEVNYLFETIRMKGLLSKQSTDVNVSIYKSVLASYLVFGLEGTLNIVSEGNKNLSLDEVLKLKKDIIDEKVLRFKENNSPIFQNLSKKIIDILIEFGNYPDIQSFSQQVRKNTFLDNFVYLVLNNNYDTYNNVLNKLYGFISYYKYDEFAAKADMYDYCNNFIKHGIQKRVIQYNNDFEQIILSNFKPKEKIIYAKRKDIGRKFIKKLKLKLFVRALTNVDKDIYKDFFNDNYDISSIKTKFISYLDTDELEFDNILNHVLIPLSNDRFDMTNCLNKLGIKKPVNYETYSNYREDLRNVTLLNSKIEKLNKNYTPEQMISIMNYICYGNALTFKVKAKDRKYFDKLSVLASLINGEIYADKSSSKFIYNNNFDLYNVDELMEYENYIDILNEIISKTYNYTNRHMNNYKITNYYSHDYFNAINTDDCVFEINNNNYELNRRVFTLKDIETIFNGFNINKYKKASTELLDFLSKDNIIAKVADGYYEGVVNNLGVIISEWEDINNYIEELNINCDHTIIGLEHILAIMNFEDNVIGKSIRKDIIKSITDNDYYQIDDLNKRIDMLIDLYIKAHSVISSTIPYVKYRDNEYEIKVIDNYNQDILLSCGNSIYKVGYLGNDFLNYSIISKNGIQLGIYKDNILEAKILGVRNGNGLFLNQLEGNYNDIYDTLLRNIANLIINETKDSIEPINFVTIVNNDVYSSQNGVEIDTTICPYITNPINKNTKDFLGYSKYENNLNYQEIITNYGDNIITLLASNIMIDKDNFKSYEVNTRYYRNRSNVLKLSNNIGEEYLNRIDNILYLCKLADHTVNINDIKLSEIDTIFLGDDFVLFVTNKRNYLKYCLPYDNRSLNEINLIMDSLGEKTE